MFDSDATVLEEGGAVVVVVRKGTVADEHLHEGVDLVSLVPTML